MEKNNLADERNQSLARLCAKYGGGGGTVTGDNANPVLHRAGEPDVTLLPWRVERRFAELKKLVDNGTLEGVSTLRFARFETAAGNLRDMLAREFDLAGFLTGDPIVRCFSVGSAETRAVNAVFRLKNGMSGCVECASSLPAGSETIDRHEIIARRGVASDRVVDTQIPQSSLYLRTDAATAAWTDTDFELFGLDSESVATVRAAWAVLTGEADGAAWNRAAARSRAWADAALANPGKTVELE